MASLSSSMIVIIKVLLLLAIFLSAGASFGYMHALLVIAMAASAAMLSAFLAVAWSRDAH
ncbi:hypothetical protein ASD64_16330 [Mesorhizobium sp. Root157]|uniref:hypothetical protein n=1 Tax=Mesorhizobium sp. Root157 TaxID=1736477 RepID=UPI0006FF2B4A|nr:hypothetical protein [Mesorhizobium sp. Root157]KQZ98526.1 hypothetical protein ASD64_16330 [Mesorhizobium sp. Root157]